MRRHAHGQSIPSTMKPRWHAPLSLQYPRDRSRPASEDLRSQAILGENDQRFELRDIRGNQDQSLTPGAPLDTQQPFHGAPLTGQAAQAIDAFSGVRDQAAICQSPNRPLEARQIRVIGHLKADERLVGPLGQL